MERIPASERTREKLKALMDGTAEGSESNSDLVRLAARLIIEEALEAEARDTAGRDYYARGAEPGAGYRNGYRSGRLKSAEGSIEYSAPQIADREEPFRSKNPRHDWPAQRGAGGIGSGDVCARAVDAGHRGAVRQRRRQVAPAAVTLTG